MHTKINADGSISVEAPLSKAGSKIIMRAELDVRLGIAACSVSESLCNSGRCTQIKVIIEDWEYNTFLLPAIAGWDKRRMLTA